MNRNMPKIVIKTDDAFQELTRHGTEEFPIEYYYEELEEHEMGCIPWHWHREFEFVVVTKGEMVCEVEDQRLVIKEGCGLFINGNVLHQFFPGSGIRAIIPNIVFAPEMLAEENSLIYKKFVRPFLSGALSYLILEPENVWQREILLFLSKIFELFEKREEGYELSVQEKMIQMWQILYAHINEMERRSENGNTVLVQGRIRKMTVYIEQHFMEKLSLAEIAQAANVSKSEAMRCFKQCLNISPINYLVRYRLHIAEKLLCRSNKSILEISAECGFESVSYFDRIFGRTFGVTPTEYRNKNYKV